MLVRRGRDRQVAVSEGRVADSALAFQFASTNLVWELGLVLWVLIGWQFTLAEYLGGLVMIALMAVAAAPVREPGGRACRARARAGGGHRPSASLGRRPPPRCRCASAALTSVQAWSDVAHNFRGDWQMLWKEIGIGLLLAGFVAQLHDSVFSDLFIRHAPAPLPALENAVVGPVIAVLSFVCSVGNVPLAAVLWSGGISFAGVLAFLFADLIVLPIVAIYRKYYGRASPGGSSR